MTPPLFAHSDPESLRLNADSERLHNWKRWGPYLSERQWGTVREDYSSHGDAWNHFSHDQARSRAYRWGEDGLLGFTDRQCRICFSLVLWNGRDPILKERLFGLTNPQGKHGEDVKECYFYLRNTPTHSYMKGLYKYPQNCFPYDELVKKNVRNEVNEPEYELTDTGIFAENKYFDITAEYAKADPEDMLIRISVTNRADRAADLHLLPQLWFRNVWSWGGKQLNGDEKPSINIASKHRWSLFRESLGNYFLEFDPNDKRLREFIFTENKTNFALLFKGENRSPIVKDGFHDYIIHRKSEAISRAGGTSKAAAVYVLHLQAGETQVIRLRLRKDTVEQVDAFAEFDGVMAAREAECQSYYDAILPKALDSEAREICLQAYAGLLWNKQFYYYRVEDWLHGDPTRPLDTKSISYRPNQEWRHLFARDVISMPDKWEYPWFAAWDLAFQAVPLAHVDPGFAKRQINLLLREWYMHPNGQIPAYEFQFSDVNPPVHAWAALRVYRADAARTGRKDREFLASIFQKLLLNFTWWVNRTDKNGQSLFSGGFLGLDNIGIFDRGASLPTGGHLQQADATAWMAFYCLCMLRISLELAVEEDSIHPAYEDMASKFLAHFVQIAEAIHTHGGTGLWHELDGFYYDHVRTDDEQTIPLKTRSLVGLLPLIAVEVIEVDELQRLPDFRRRFEWYLQHGRFFSRHVVHENDKPLNGRTLLSLASRERLLRVLRPMLDEEEFLSPQGIRSLSRYHLAHPFKLTVGEQTYQISYTPGESESEMFGGNSNWRGPVWFPINFLLVEALERFHLFLGDDFRVEYPTHSGHNQTLAEIARDLKKRHASLFRRTADGVRPCHGNNEAFAHDPAWNDLILFHEYFHGDTGFGLGASHQTGWTALVTVFLEELAESGALAK